MANLFKEKKLILLLIIALLIKVFLSVSTIHADLIAFSFAGKVITEGNIFSFYDYLFNLPPGDKILSIYPPNLFIYPPLPYFYFGLIHLISNIFLSDGFIMNIVYNYVDWLGNLRLNWFLFLFKFPYMIFDLEIAFLLSTFFKEKREKIAVFLIWLFNPVNFYVTYMMGQFDIIPAFLTVLSIFFAKKSKYVLAAVFLGVGSSFKIYPLLFVLPLAFLEKRSVNRLKIIVIGFLTYMATTFLYIASIGYRNSAFLADHSLKSLYANLPISGGESIILFLAAILFVYIVFYFSKNTTDDLWKKYFSLLLIFFMFTHYHPQWFLWITPFLIIELASNKYRHLILSIGILISYFGLVSFFDAGLTTRIFSPINKSLNILPDFWTNLNLNPDINFTRSLFQTIFVGIALYYLYYYFPKKNEHI